jgi:hypothetical protein
MVISPFWGTVIVNLKWTDYPIGVGAILTRKTLDGVTKMLRCLLGRKCCADLARPVICIKARLTINEMKVQGRCCSR